MRTILLLVAVALELPTAYTQTLPQKSEFEVASVKPCTADSRGRGMGPAPGRLNTGCVTLHDLIQLAYGAFANGPSFNARRLRVLGGPQWLESDRYVIDAKAEGGVGIAQTAGPMLRALLEERFKLKIHKETRDMPIYALTVATSGLKMTPLKEDSCVAIDLDHLPPPVPGQPTPNFCGRMMMTMKDEILIMEAHGTTMTNLAAGALSDRLDRPVIDKTGLTRMFDVHLEFTPSDAIPGFPGRGGPENPGASPAPQFDAAGPSIFTALQQLGLKLSADHGPGEVLVIDFVERPSTN